jgi:predicted O-methyltransferase YrrM
MVDLRRRFWSIHLPLMAVPGQTQRRLDSLEEFPSVVEQLYNAVGEVTGCRVFVDSSKEPHYSMILRERTDLDIRFLHLVRDPRAIGQSWSRRRSETGHRDAVEMERRGPLKVTGYFNVSNLAAERFWRDEPGRYLRVRYEDFVANPQKSLETIADFMEEDLDLTGVLDGMMFTPGPTHTVWGNPNRFDFEPRPIRRDDAWIKEQGTLTSLFLSVSNAPVASRYGYRILGSDPMPQSENEGAPVHSPYEWETTWEIVKSWQGWMREAQGKALWNAAERVKPGGQIVEIGSFQGKSAAVLARSAEVSVTVVAIDPHAGNDRGPGEWDGVAEDGQADHEAFLANLTEAGVVERVTHAREFSNLASGLVEGPIDFLYIDGAHGYGPASDDITRWGDRVVVGGAMFIHNVYNSLFVTLAVLRHLSLSRRWRYVGRVRSLAMYERVNLGPFGVLRNFVLHAASLPWFVRNAFVRLLRTVGLEKLARPLGHVPGEGMY